jgi:branched-chain amino acid transport system ATP-binding protein
MVDELRKQFGGLAAVDNLSFTVQEGEIMGFIGPNGAGKSTTFNCITGRFPPTSGTVYYHGEDVTGEPAHRMVQRGLARTFQEFRTLDDRNVVENIKISLVPDRLFSVSELSGEMEAEAIRIAERVGLGDDLWKDPDELPHAGALRLELGRSLANDPDMMLIDEPFAGLSGPEVETVSELLLELREEGITLVVVDHNMRGLLDLIDRAIVIRFGSMLAEGTPTEIKNDPEVQEAYLGGESV